MPTYAYACPAGHEFERFERKISEQLRARCPECGKWAQRQISGGAGLLFKGSGFYITDYGKGGADKGDAGAGKGEGAEKKSDTTGKKADTGGSASGVTRDAKKKSSGESS